MKFYTGNNTGDTPGNLPDPYYWWEAGALFGAMVDYWAITGDESYVDVTRQALTHQMSDTKDFMPENQTMTMGNDDQGFWAMAAMSAAEQGFPNPPEGETSYLGATQGVFNNYIGRWSEKECGGGLRWQVFSFNNGFGYKNTISNGCFFNIATRLARYTGNSTYGDWAKKVIDWQTSMDLITDKGEVKDGVHIGDGDCSNKDPNEWSYNSAIFLSGCAVMYSISEGDDKDFWKKKLDTLLKHALEKFISKDGIVYEQFCEPFAVCNTDQQSFKGYFLRWLTLTRKVAPYTNDDIQPVLEKAAEAAAASCSGNTAGEVPPFTGHPDTACGYVWTPKGTQDNLHGVSEQMSAMSAIIYSLDSKDNKVKTQANGGTSEPDYTAGGSDANRIRQERPITGGDRAGAGFLTTLLCAGVIAGSAFLLI
jgi:mannan endo-1,6-alpha-mannosidase